MDLAGGSLIFLAFVVALIVAVAYGYYSRRGDIGARRDRLGNVNVGKDVASDVRTWGRGSETSAHHRHRRMTPLEQRTADAIGPPAVRARATGAIQLAAPVDPARDHVLGPPEAAVTLVEYGEYECRYCKEADLVIAHLREAHPDDVRLVFRHFPQAAVHALAIDAAVAAEAAARQGRFWELHTAMARTKKPLEEHVLLDLAHRQGLDLDRFAADLADPALRERVDEDLRSGVASGVNGTPTFFLNGVRYDDDVEEAELEAAVARVLDATTTR
jgi:protein-disulfide isomerase